MAKQTVDLNSFFAQMGTMPTGRRMGHKGGSKMFGSVLSKVLAEVATNARRNLMAKASSASADSIPDLKLMLMTQGATDATLGQSLPAVADTQDNNKVALSGLFGNVSEVRTFETQFDVKASPSPVLESSILPYLETFLRSMGLDAHQAGLVITNAQNESGDLDLRRFVSSLKRTIKDLPETRGDIKVSPGEVLGAALSSVVSGGRHSENLGPRAALPQVVSDAAVQDVEPKAEADFSPKNFDQPISLLRFVEILEGKKGLPPSRQLSGQPQPHARSLQEQSSKANTPRIHGLEPSDSGLLPALNDESREDRVVNNVRQAIVAAKLRSAGDAAPSSPVAQAQGVNAASVPVDLVVSNAEGEAGGKSTVRNWKANRSNLRQGEEGLLIERGSNRMSSQVVTGGTGFERNNQDRGGQGREQFMGNHNGGLDVKNEAPGVSSVERASVAPKDFHKEGIGGGADAIMADARSFGGGRIMNGSIGAGSHTPHAVPSYIVNQVAMRLGNALKTGLNSLRINLSPPNLGTVQLKISFKDRNLNVSMVAENPSVREVLMSSVNDLRKSLNDQGVLLTKLDVEVDRGFDKAFGQASDRFSGQSNGQTGADGGNRQNVGNGSIGNGNDGLADNGQDEALADRTSNGLVDMFA